MAINECYFEEPDPQAKEAISKQKNDFRHRSTAFFNICMHMLTVLDCFTFNIIYVRIVAEVIYHMLDSCNAQSSHFTKNLKKNMETIFGANCITYGTCMPEFKICQARK